MKKKVFKALIFCTILLNYNDVICQSPCAGGGDQNGASLTKLKNKLLQIWVVIGFRVLDPNELQGQQGYGVKKYVSKKDKLGYTISFENDGQFADAPVQNAIIYFPVPDSLKLDINSLKLGNFGFGKYDFQVPDNVSSYTTRLNLIDSLGIDVDVTAGIDITNKRIFWLFKSIDPATGIAPNDARGFLPVSDTGAAHLADTTGKGQGYVNFYITPKSNAVTGDTIPTQASIIFDVNEAIPTNTWNNTIDAVSPTSRIISDTATGNIITLNWMGIDDPGGSGVRDYELYASENGGPFKLYKSNITDTFTTYEATPGSSYCFFTLATDNTGNKETMKTGCEASAQVTVLPVTWLYFEGHQQNDNVVLGWGTVNEINTKKFIIERSFDAMTFLDIDSVPAINNPSLTNNYKYVDKDAMLQKTTMLYYRLKQVDIDGRFIYSTIIHFPVTQNVGAPEIKAYPNPFEQSITLQVLNVTPTDKTNSVSLYSIEGRMVYKRNLGIPGPATILLQDLPALVPGVYILSASINGKLYTVKMIKMNK